MKRDSGPTMRTAAGTHLLRHAVSTQQKIHLYSDVPMHYDFSFPSMNITNRHSSSVKESERRQPAVSGSDGQRTPGHRHRLGRTDGLPEQQKCVSGQLSTAAPGPQHESPLVHLAPISPFVRGNGAIVGGTGHWKLEKTNANRLRKPSPVQDERTAGPARRAETILGPRGFVVEAGD